LWILLSGTTSFMRSGVIPNVRAIYQIETRSFGDNHKASLESTAKAL